MLPRKHTYGSVRAKDTKFAQILTSRSFPGRSSHVIQLGTLFSTANQQDAFSTSHSLVLIGPCSGLVIPLQRQTLTLSQTPQKNDTRPYRNIALMTSHLSAYISYISYTFMSICSLLPHIQVCFTHNVTDLRVDWSL